MSCNFKVKLALDVTSNLRVVVHDHLFSTSADRSPNLFDDFVCNVFSEEHDDSRLVILSLCVADIIVGVDVKVCYAEGQITMVQ